MSIHIDSCAERETLVVTTRFNVYEVIVLPGDGDILVRDRKHFTEFRRASFLGSRAEDGSLDPQTIDIGVRMMFLLDGMSFITSVVESIFRPHVRAASMECAAAR